MRILLPGAAVFLALWFTILRPKAEEVPPATTTTPGNVNTGQPAQSEAGKIVEKAKTAATEAEGAAKAAAGETTDATKTAPGTATTTAPDAKADPAAAAPADQLAKLPKDVAKAVTGHKVMVLAVLADKGKHWRPMADDDRYVRNTLKTVNRYDGDVFVKQVPLAKIDSYGVIMNDLDINQTPSVVVVDTKLKANVIEGYLDRVSINQAIADARGDSISPLITDSYLRAANQVCASSGTIVNRWSLPTTRGHKGLVASVKRFRADFADYVVAVKRLKAPARWRVLDRAWMKYNAGEMKRADKLVKAVRTKNLDAVAAIAAAPTTKAERRLDRRFNDAGLTSCATNRSK
jgi:hypothetical protein